MSELSSEKLKSIVFAEATRLADTLMNDEKRVRIFLFGSRAEGVESPVSDFDLGIELDHPVDALMMTRIRESFDTLNILQSVDVVDFSTTTEDFNRVALRAVEVIVER